MVRAVIVYCIGTKSRTTVSRHLFRHSDGCKWLYSYSKRDNCAASCNTYRQRRCDGCYPSTSFQWCDRRDCFRRYSCIHVFVEYYCNYSGYYRTYLWHLSGDSNRYEWLFLNATIYRQQPGISIYLQLSHQAGCILFWRGGWFCRC